MGLVISQLTIDASDPVALARWWADALGWQLDPDSDDEEVSISPAGELVGGWLFIRVPDAKQVKNRLHVDLRPSDGSDQDTELVRLLELGATRVDIGQGDVPWHVLADPEGNEFCLLLRTPSALAELVAQEHAADSGPVEVQ
ncbi:VOC family protein [Cellulomonas sp. HZM]|uniref:VOC family protein n=1 Tax=Cellulomonas sp. HZM TaxID=1454010 RepID=UPI00055163F3|nr:VOC family protein [Cellulomonas sp. HZM]